MKKKRKPGQLFAQRCAECGEILASTPSGYLACPRGHGKLIEDDTHPSQLQPGAEPPGLFAEGDRVKMYGVDWTHI